MRSQCWRPRLRRPSSGDNRVWSWTFPRRTRISRVSPGDPCCYHRIMAGTASRASRRVFLGSALAALKLAAQSQKSPALAQEWRRFEDPTTEIEVVRLTDPAHSSALPAYYNRTVTRNSASLIYGADRTGQPQAFRIDLKTGEARQLTEVAELDVASMALSPASRSEEHTSELQSLRH